MLGLEIKNSQAARSRQTPHQEVIQCLAADTVCGSTEEEEKSLDDRQKDKEYHSEKKNQPVPASVCS